MIGKVIVTNELSSRMSRRAVGPKRTRIFYYAAPTWPRVRLSVKSPIGVADPQERLLLPCALELGGKDAAIVLADAVPPGDYTCENPAGTLKAGSLSESG